MALFDTSGITKPVVKLGNAIVMVVEPVANLLEMASESSNSWAKRHSADLAAKNERAEAVRIQTHRDLLRKALIKAQETHLETNELERATAFNTEVDALAGRVHEARAKTLKEISPDVIARLAQQQNLTKADILRAVNVGSSAKILTEEEVNEVTSKFSLDRFSDRK